MPPSKNSAYQLSSNDSILDNVGKKYVLRVRDLPQENRPRERLIENGPGALSSPELLAVLLNTGTKKEEILSMANRVLKEYGSRLITSETNPKTLAREFNIPLVKACQIVACFELGRRFFQPVKNGQVTLRTARQTYHYLKDMAGLTKEHLRGVYLNSHYRVIHDEVISVGSLTANIVHPREVFRPAIECCAAAVIVAHNHPSGSVKPTSSDVEITRQLARAGEILGIDLLDHIVIGKNGFASVVEDGKNKDNQ